MTKTMCPCGSGKIYADCCAGFHQGSAIPETAETLMRSRYSAFVLKNEEYLIATRYPEKRREESVEELRHTFANTHWLGLSVLATEKGSAAESTGRVSFAAKYQGSDGKEAVLYESSRFVKEKGRWYYLDGTHELGRNDRCWCGSGRKFKKCHG